MAMESECGKWVRVGVAVESECGKWVRVGVAVESGCGHGEWVWEVGAAMERGWESVEWEHSCTGDVEVWKGYVVRTAGV